MAMIEKLFPAFGLAVRQILFGSKARRAYHGLSTPVARLPKAKQRQSQSNTVVHRQTDYYVEVSTQ